MRPVALFFLVILAGWPSLSAADPVTPPRGSALRAELLDTVRVMAEYDLGAPVEFVVTELHAEGDRAFGRLMAQRPGGPQIDMAATPIVMRRGVSVDMIDGLRIEVFFHRVGERWYLYEYGLGSTDVWWWGFECQHYGAFLRDWGC